MILKTLPVGPLEVNCYLLGDEISEKAIVIDPGEDAQQIAQLIENEGLQLEFIVLTHGHFDHVSGVAGLKTIYPQAQLLAHEEDLFLIKDARASAARWGIDAVQCPKPDRLITDGDVLKAGSLRLEVRHTPGHSPGGICLLWGHRVFVGDTLFQGSVGRTDFRGGSFETLAASIRAQLYTLPAETVVHPGHGPATTIGAEMKGNQFVRNAPEECP